MEVGEILSVCGIIAEFNPLHTGHKFLIDKAKEYGTVVCAISSNFVQRGDSAIFEKRIRAKSALLCGADIIVEMPVLWSMSTAQNFALCGVAQLIEMGCDKIIFGSESGDIEALKKCADILVCDEYEEKITQNLKLGKTFAKLRQETAEELGAPKGILEGANNNLAIEYIIAGKKLGFDGEFLTVKREGAMHDTKDIDKFVSASLLREKLQSLDIDFCKEYIPSEISSLVDKDNISNIKNIERAILSVLRLKTKEDLKKLPDISEGIENKLFSAINVADSLDSLYNEIKVKRYTLSRIRRLVLSAFLGFDKDFFLKKPPYVRVLGFSKTGEVHLKSIAKNNEKIVTTVSQIEKLPKDAQKVLEIECKATDLYALSLPKALPCGLEYTSKVIKHE